MAVRRILRYTCPLSETTSLVVFVDSSWHSCFPFNPRIPWCLPIWYRIIVMMFYQFDMIASNKVHHLGFVSSVWIWFECCNDWLQKSRRFFWLAPLTHPWLLHTTDKTLLVTLFASPIPQPAMVTTPTSINMEKICILNPYQNPKRTRGGVVKTKHGIKLEFKCMISTLIFFWKHPIPLKVQKSCTSWGW